jgi:hypothetical protein
MQKNSLKSLVYATLAALAWTSAIDYANADARAALSADGTTQYSDRLSPGTGVALTLPSERAAVTSARMQGRWLAQSEDGATTLLELRAGGGFSFDHQAQVTPEREYTCGDWALERDELALFAKTLKTRAATGDIQLSQDARKRTFTVLAARTDVLILRGDGGTLTFHRHGA